MKKIKENKLILNLIGIIVYVIFSVMIAVGFIILPKKYNVFLLIAMLVCVGLLCLFLYCYIYKDVRKIKKIYNLYNESYINEKELINEINISPVINDIIKTLVNKLNKVNILDMTQKQSQYQALQNQINPHFLYNTLESIRSEALCSDIMSVANMAEALARFFRYTISNINKLVTVSDELRNVETYFSIQKYRFEEKIKIEYNFDYDEVKNYCIPKLCLQPIVENAICHGLEEKIGVGTVKISITATRSRLIIKVSDDGIGMSGDKMDSLNRKMIGNLLDSASETIDTSSKNGIALINVNNRIKLLFGEEYGINIYSIESMGTDVEISTPIIEDKEYEKRNFKI